MAQRLGDRATYRHLDVTSEDGWSSVVAELEASGAGWTTLVTSAGAVKDLMVQPNPATGGWRVSFVLAPGNAALCDLRCTLKRGDELLSEVWSYRWTL